MADVNKVSAAIRRTERSRKKLRGTSDRPRLSVEVSNRNIRAQIVDDSQGITLAAVQSPDKGTLTEKATHVGVAIAEAAKKAKISKVVFDRGAKQYHGRVQNVADAARKAGLEF